MILSESLSELLNHLSGISTLVIAAAFLLHLGLFFVLWIWSNRDLRRLVRLLDDFTRGIKHRSVLGSSISLPDQVEAFIADVNEVLDAPSNKSDRETLLQRMKILDERRNYLSSLFFETTYHVCRTMIEAYPLAGVLGTILAIGAALQADPSAGAVGVSTIVSRFGDAIWSTFAGLSAAILLMFLNSLVETAFLRLSENRVHVREMVARTKRELALNSGGAE